MEFTKSTHRIDLATKSMIENRTEDMPYYRLCAIILGILTVGLMLGVGVLLVRVQKIAHRLEQSEEILLRGI